MEYIYGKQWHSLLENLTYSSAIYDELNTIWGVVFHLLCAKNGKIVLNQRIMRKYHTQVGRIKNGTVSKNNKSGRSGVWYNEKRDEYQAYIVVHYKKIHLGLFKNYEEAVAAREEAEHQYFDPLIAAINDEFGA